MTSTIMFISEFDYENTVMNKDKWFMFTDEEQEIVKDHFGKR
jgi:TRAP-type C4-dicarboxylate transport system substrate-binding protein